MTGRDDELGFLGKHRGEAVIVQTRKAQTTVHSFEEGWTIVAARTGAPPKLHFRAIVRRCMLGETCGRARCLGHDHAVERLATKIRKTYQ